MHQPTPELIPHTEFHKGRWLLPVDGADWYYFMKKPGKHEPSRKGFLSSVDRPLRELVRFFQGKKLRTTPSCSGHHFKSEEFEKIYDALEQDRDKVNTSGLELKDVETGESYFFKDASYRLPWSKQDFLEKIKRYQQTGVIGFETGNKEVKDELLKLHIDGARVMIEDDMVFVLTYKNEHGDNDNLWHSITRKIKSAFRKAATRKHTFSSAGRTE